MIYLTGDIHGSKSVCKFNTAHFKDGKNLTKNDYVIILGDFGLVWDNIPTKNEKYWLEWLNKKPWTTLFVDGNHENHIKLQELEKIKMFGGTVGKVNNSVFHLRRGEIYNIDNNSFFVMGGAYSIDKNCRIENMSWWKDEEPTHAEYEYGLKNLEKHNNKVDYIISHTCPISIIKEYINSTDNKLYEMKMDSVSKYFETIIEFVDFKKQYCGHFHDNWTSKNKKHTILYDDIIKLGNII